MTRSLFSRLLLLNWLFLAIFILFGVAGYILADHLNPLQRALLIFAFIIFAMFGTLHFSYNITHGIAEQLKQIEKKAEAINAGDFGTILPNSNILELSHLINAINTMSLRLQTQISTISIEREKFDFLLQNLREGIFAISSERIILFQNASIPRELIPPNSQSRRILDAIQNKELLDFIIRHIDSNTDGRISIELNKRHYSIRLYSLKNNNKSFLYMGAIMDKTEEKEMQNLREEFVQSASHELKTPITSIKGYTETLIERLSFSSDSIEKKFLDAILRNTDRMIHIIDDMLLISKLENHKTVFQPEKFYLKKIVEEIRLTIDGLMKLKSQTFKVNMSDDLYIHADMVLLEHVLLNLIKNASSYSPEKSTVELKIERQENNLIILVIDEGIGISEEDSKRVFERFYRVDKNRSRKEGGTGLGLSIVKHIVNQHQGEVSVFPNPTGKGSIFKVVLPQYGV